MKKEFKELITESKRSLEKVEKKIESFSEDFSEEANGLWDDIKKRLSHVERKLKDAYDNFEDEAELKGHLGIMEARDQIENLRETLDKFTHKVSNNMQEELDIVGLRAHLAKMESEDLWIEKQKDITQLYGKSKIEVENLAKRSLEEMNHIFLKLTKIV